MFKKNGYAKKLTALVMTAIILMIPSLNSVQHVFE